MFTDAILVPIDDEEKLEEVLQTLFQNIQVNESEEIMDVMELWQNVNEIAQNKTANPVIFGILQLKNQIDYALESGLTQAQIEETIKDALNANGKIYL